MTNLNYGVSVTKATIGELPQYKIDWKINTADLISSGGASYNYAAELAYIKSLGLRARLDIENDIWAGGQIQSPISSFANYFASLKAAGWTNVCSEGRFEGDPTYIKNNFGMDYTNYNCDQCGLWRGLYNESGTALNLWEAYYPSEVGYITSGAASGKPNGVLAGAWANNGGDNQILTNSQSGGQPSYQSIIASLLALGHSVTDFEVWGGSASSRAWMNALGFTSIVQNLQKTYPANGYAPSPTPGPTPTPVANPIASIVTRFQHVNATGTMKIQGWAYDKNGKPTTRVTGLWGMMSYPTVTTWKGMMWAYPRASDGYFEYTISGLPHGTYQFRIQTNDTPNVYPAMTVTDLW